MYTEEELIENCKRGDPVAQEALYKRFAPRMRYVCQRYARTSFEVEDIFQEAFVKVLLNIQRFSGKGSLEGWIRKIFVHTAIDYYKKNSRWADQRQLDDNDNDTADLHLADEYFEQLANSLSSDDLLSIVNKLPDGYRVVFNLYAIEGFTHAQIAESLKVTEGTSKSQLSKARKMLRELIKEQVAKRPAEVVQFKMDKSVANWGFSV